jgi:hypothetical protein
MADVGAGQRPRSGHDYRTWPHLHAVGRSRLAPKIGHRPAVPAAVLSGQRPPGFKYRACRTCGSYTPWRDHGNNISMRNSQAGGRWCSEAEVRQIIGTEGAEAFIGVISGGWGAYLDERRVRSRRTRANVVWDNMVEVADRDLVAHFDGVHRVDIHGSAAYVLSDRLLLRFKKHDRKMRTSNVLTAVQGALWRQGYLDGMPDLAHVTCGYVLDKAEAGIEKFVVVRATARQRKPEWIIDLAELAAGKVTPVQPVLPGIDGQADEVAPLPSIRRRRAEDSEQ